jgi:hypothetical protein
VATGSDVEVLPMTDSNIEFPCFTPDGNYLFYCRRSPQAPLYRQLFSVPSLGGQEQQRAFDVDSTRDVFARRKTRGVRPGGSSEQLLALLVLNLDTKKETQLATIPFPGTGRPIMVADGKLIAVPIVTPPPAGEPRFACSTRVGKLARHPGIAREHSWTEWHGSPMARVSRSPGSTWPQP